MKVPHRIPVYITYGGSNRTIIKQAYEMLVSERTAFAKKPIGALVTLDKVFELVEGNLSNEKRTVRAYFSKPLTR